MANFVLVHGGWRGGWVWERCASLLRADGHRVYAPTLTGLGDRSHLISSSINLSTHIQDVLNLIKFEQLTDVVLCGHFYGGMIITAVADAIPEKITSLVYLDAFLPGDGDSIASLNGPRRVSNFARAFESQSLGQGDGKQTRYAPSPGNVLRTRRAERKISIGCAKALHSGHRTEPNPFEAFMMSVREDHAWTIATIRQDTRSCLTTPRRSHVCSRLPLEACP